MERDNRAHRGTTQSAGFQLTRSRGARQQGADVESHTIDFNSRAHVERDFPILVGGTSRRRISTHALTWSATLAVRHFCAQRVISTHALTWSATKTPAERREALRISTHALTWSATPPPRRCVLYPSFQLTRSRGARHIFCLTSC